MFIYLELILKLYTSIYTYCTNGGRNTCRNIFPLFSLNIATFQIKASVMKSRIIYILRLIIFKQICKVINQECSHIRSYVTVSISSDFQLFYKFSFIFIRYIWSGSVQINQLLPSALCLQLRDDLI